MKKYVVREGDTMWSIAEANGIRPKLLMASNPQVRNPNQLKPGTVIVIPELTKPQGTGKGAIGTIHPEATTPGTPATGSHKEVPEAPHAQTPSTKGPATTGTGQKGPGMAPFFGFVWPHAVQPGESWQSIQQKYNVQMDHLLQMNPGLAHRPLRPGDLLYVPGMVPSSELPAWAEHGTTPSPQQAGYGVSAPGHATATPGYGAQPPAYGTGVSAPGHATATPGYGAQPPGYGTGAPMPGHTPAAPGYGTEPPGYGTGGTPGTSQPPSSQQWVEPYGPHQHHPYRVEDGGFAADAWGESSSWDVSYGIGNDWRNGSGFAQTEPYHKFPVPEAHKSEISVYLGDPDDGPGQTEA